MAFENTDFLGTEKIPKLMAKFCIPCILSLLVSALYNIVDQIFVGNSELSTLGNAATGVVFPIFTIAQGFAWYFGDGCAAYINIHQGKGDTDKNHRCVGTGMTLTLIVSVVLLALFYPLKTPLLAKYGAMSHYGVDIPIAVIGIESKVFTVVINIVVGIVLGCQPIIGYNMGAQNHDRVKKLYRAILMCTVGVGLIATLLFETAPNAVVGIFGSPTNIPNPDDYWDFARKTFRIFLMLVTFTCTIKMSSIFFQAVGKPVFAVLASLIRDIICFVPLVCVLPVFYGINGILWAAPIADALAMAVTAVLTVLFFKEAKPESTFIA